MPSKNSLKTYIENSYYHLYNRGVEKRIIFQDNEDYIAFLADLKLYLTPYSTRSKHLKGFSLKEKYYPSQLPLNHADQIQLIAYCLMPNHFHLCVKQSNSDAINHFMRSLCTKYAMYFNKKYHRVGSRFQGVYKAVLIEDEGQFIQLSKYIHRNPLTLLSPSQLLSDYQYSSYRNFLGISHQNWIHPDNISYSYSTSNPLNSYQQFVEESPSLVDNDPRYTLENDQL